MTNTIKLMVGNLVKKEANITGTILNKDAGFRAKEIKYVSGTGSFTIKVENSSYVKEINLYLIEELSKDLIKGIENKDPIHIDGFLSGDSFLWNKILVNGIDINRI